MFRLDPPQQPNRTEKASRLGCGALEKSYRKGDLVIPVLRGVDLKVASGEFLSVSGQSGSGKSTLLHVLGLLDAPSVGEIHCDGRRIDNLTESQRDEHRNRKFGFIFQPFHFDGSRDESLFRFSWFPFHGHPEKSFIFLRFQFKGDPLAHLPFFISCKNNQVGCIRGKPFIDLD